MLGESLFNQKDYLGAIDAYRQVLEEKRKARLETRFSQGWAMPTFIKRIMMRRSIIGRDSSLIFLTIRRRMRFFTGWQRPRF